MEWTYHIMLELDIGFLKGVFLLILNLMSRRGSMFPEASVSVYTSAFTTFHTQWILSVPWFWYKDTAISLGISD